MKICENDHFQKQKCFVTLWKSCIDGVFSRAFNQQWCFCHFYTKIANHFWCTKQWCKGSTLRKAVKFFVVVFLVCFFNSLFLIHSFNSLGYYLFHNKHKPLKSKIHQMALLRLKMISVNFGEEWRRKKCGLWRNSQIYGSLFPPLNRNKKKYGDKNAFCTDRKLVIWVRC